MASKSERAEAIERLREFLNPGDTVHTVLRNVSRSGMSRSIDAYVFKHDERSDTMVKHWLSYSVAKAGIGTWDNARECVKMGGTGMDMGFALVYSLSATLYPDGHGCTGDKCPSNDHSNGDRDYTPHVTPRQRCRLCLDVPGRDGLGNPCRGCDGATGYTLPTVEGMGHWHSDGGYALRHAWI